MPTGGIKGLAKDTAVYGLSSIIGRTLNWLMVPLYARVLTGTEEFGIYTNLYGWVALLLVCLLYGMETAFFRFVNKEGPEGALRVYATSLCSVGVSSLIFVAAALTLLNPICSLTGYTAHRDYVALLLCVTATDAVCAIPFAFLRYQRRPLRFAIIKLLSIALNIAANIFFLLVCPKLQQTSPAAIAWFYRPDYSVGYVFVANAIASGITLLALVPTILPALRCKPDHMLLKRMLRYAFPILILGIAGIFNQTADKILFPALFADRTFALQQLGIYGACFKLAVVMVVFIQAFRYAYEPFVFARHKDRHAADNKPDTAAYVDAMNYFIAFSLFIFLAVTFYIDILKYFVAPAYYAGLPVVPIVMMGEVFFGIYFNLSFWYKLNDHTAWGAYFSLAGCAATVAIILTFAPTFGFIACAWAACASNLLMLLLSFFVGQRKYPIPYDLKSAAILTLTAAALYAAANIPAIQPLPLRLAYRTLLLALFALLTLRKLPLRPKPSS